MVSHGLVERRADPYDGRATMLALTDAGEALLSEAQGWFGSVLHRALDGWGLEEIGCVERFLTALEAEFVTGPPRPRTRRGWSRPENSNKTVRPTSPPRNM